MGFEICKAFNSVFIYIFHCVVFKFKWYKSPKEEMVNKTAE